MSNPNPRTGLTGAARERVEEELRRLRAQRETLAPNLAEEDFAGDRADQAEVLERAEVAAHLDRQIAELTDILVHGQPPADDDDPLLPAGTKVTLRFPDGDEEDMRVIALAEQASADEQVLTADSPLGRALVGKKKGDQISWRTPGGEASAEVVKLRRPAHH